MADQQGGDKTGSGEGRDGDEVGWSRMELVGGRRMRMNGEWEGRSRGETTGVWEGNEMRYREQYQSQRTEERVRE